MIKVSFDNEDFTFGDFGFTLKQLRQLSGLTQQEFAQALDVDASHLSRIERGMSNPSFELIEKSLAFFNLKLCLKRKNEERNASEVEVTHPERTNG